MMDAKARQDCIKEIDLLKVRIFIMTFFFFFFDWFCFVKKVVFRSANKAYIVKEKAVLPIHVTHTCMCVYKYHT